MQSINFDKGYKTYAINGDENNVIRINVADLSIKVRMKEMYSHIAALESEYRNAEKPTAEQYAEVDKKIKSEINYAIGTDVCTPAFGLLNCLTILPDSGKSVAQSFLEALTPIIQNDVDEYVEKIQKLDKRKMNKYLEPTEKNGIEKVDIEKLSQEEKDKILSEMFK